MPVVYMATNTVNGKRYIGYTSKTLEMRKASHFHAARNSKLRKRMVFSRALNKYGEDKFVFIVLKDNLTASEGLALEAQLISKLKPEYNTATNPQKAFGAKWTEARREKMSIRLREAWTDERRTAQRERMSKNKYSEKRVNFSLTDETKAKLREASLTETA